MNGQSKSRVPAWAVVLGVLAFICAQAAFHFFVFREESAPRAPLTIFLGALIGSIAATWIMLIGFVNVDAGRRGMSRTLWTLVAIFVPNGIGLVLYFLLRRPLESVCPQCGAGVPAKANYCPRCSHRVALLCPHCNHTIASGDVYCANCGQGIRIQPEPGRPLTIE
jgi:hypothetical protein